MNWRPIDLTGMFTPFRQNEQPVLINLPSEPGQTWVSVYSTVEKLEASMLFMKQSGYKIKHIDDGVDFVESITEHGIRIMLDPHPTDRGTTKWTEIKGPGPDSAILPNDSPKAG